MRLPLILLFESDCASVVPAPGPSCVTPPQEIRGEGRGAQGLALLPHFPKMALGVTQEGFHLTPPQRPAAPCGCGDASGPPTQGWKAGRLGMTSVEGGSGLRKVPGTVTDVTEGGTERFLDSPSTVSGQGGCEGSPCPPQSVARVVSVLRWEVLSHQARGRGGGGPRASLALAVRWSPGRWALPA